MPSLADNPFAALTIVVAPAILTNASSVLCLGTGNRIARVVDRTRIVRAELDRLSDGDGRRALYEQQLSGLKVRSNLLLRAMRLFYASIGSFAAAALISVGGSVLDGVVGPLLFHALALLGLFSGTVGVAGLVIGCALMVHETRLAVRDLGEEAALASLGGAVRR